MTTDSPIAYLKLKSADAQKLGRNGGDVSYLILTDPDRQQLYITINGNSGGGYYSTEIVSLAAVEACLPDDNAQPIAAKSLAAAFVGKSANNPSFMAAILRSEGLLGPVENKPNQHQIAGDWSAWKSTMLALDGLPYVPPVKAGLVVVPEAELTGSDPALRALEWLFTITGQRSKAGPYHSRNDNFWPEVLSHHGFSVTVHAVSLPDSCVVVVVAERH